MYGLDLGYIQQENGIYKKIITQKKIFGFIVFEEADYKSKEEIFDIYMSRINSDFSALPICFNGTQEEKSTNASCNANQIFKIVITKIDDCFACDAYRHNDWKPGIYEFSCKTHVLTEKEFEMLIYGVIDGGIRGFIVKNLVWRKENGIKDGLNA